MGLKIGSQLKSPPKKDTLKDKIDDVKAAMKAQNVQRVQDLLQTHFSGTYWTNKQKRLQLFLDELLIFAAYTVNSPDILGVLITKGANRNAQGKRNSQTPLMAAVLGGHADNVRHLCTIKVDLNTQDAQGDTALHYAVIVDAAVLDHTLNMYGILSNAGADKTIKNAKGQTAEELRTSLEENRCKLNSEDYVENLVQEHATVIANRKTAESTRHTDADEREANETKVNPKNSGAKKVKGNGKLGHTITYIDIPILDTPTPS